MTGFGKGEGSNDEFRVVVEIKSVNHRYKDYRFRMPSLMSSLEIHFKKRFAEVFKRGSFDISINYKKADTKNSFSDVDVQKVEAFVKGIKGLPSLSDFKLSIKPTDFLRSEFYKDIDDDEKSLKELACTAFDKALDSLQASRLEEGVKMKKILLSHRDQYESVFNAIVESADTFQGIIEKKLRDRMGELSSEISVDEPRLLQEVIYYLEKMDIHEEINRVKSHLKKFDMLIEEDKEIGRQLDFLVQELNRETNTIGSKSSLVEISDSVVKMKVELEKIREQGLNLQ